MATANEHDRFHVVRCDEVAIVLTDLLCDCLEESSRTSSTYYYEADLYSGWTDRVHVTIYIYIIIIIIIIYFILKT